MNRRNDDLKAVQGALEDEIIELSAAYKRIRLIQKSLGLLAARINALAEELADQLVIIAPELTE